MKQSAAERPDPTTQRKAAIARGAALDHTGKVRVEPIPNFDLDRTIFKTLEGRLARFVVTTRVGKEVHWDADDPKETLAAMISSMQSSQPASRDAENFLALEECLCSSPC